MIKCRISLDAIKAVVVVVVVVVIAVVVKQSCNTLLTSTSDGSTKLNPLNSWWQVALGGTAGESTQNNQKMKIFL